MKRVLVWGGAGLLVAAGLLAVYVQQRIVSLESERVSEDVHVVRGLGGNVGVLRTGSGAVVVDTMTFRIQGERIRELAERLAGGPIQAVLNTHYHIDHSHGNPGFAPGTRVIATERTKAYMLGLDGSYWDGAAAETLPNDVFRDEHELRVGGKTVRSFHLGAGHTGGDLVVLFVEDRVLHTGDLFFHDRYPNIDLEGGGSLPAWIATLDRVLELDFERVIPGHGATTDRQGLLDFQAFLRELWEVGSAAARDGLALDATLARAKLTRDAGYETIGIPFVFRLDRDFVVRRAWEEATGSVKAVALPAVPAEAAP